MNTRNGNRTSRNETGAVCITGADGQHEAQAALNHTTTLQGEKEFNYDESSDDEPIFDTSPPTLTPIGDANVVVQAPSTAALAEAWQFFVRHQGAQGHEGNATNSSSITTQDLFVGTMGNNSTQLQGHHRMQQPQGNAWGSSITRQNSVTHRDSNALAVPERQHQPPVAEVQVARLQTEDIEIATAAKNAFSYRNAKKLQENHIKRRIVGTVKGHIFRKVKFLTCPEYYERVMKVIVEMEKPQDTARFVRIYKTAVVGAINTKRSACEQAALDAVHELLKRKNHIDEVDPPPYSMETLCKLRQSQTTDEKEAFQWFVGTLLQCVVGKTIWGRKKYQVMISDAVHANTSEKIITVSDEAFALVMYENYIEKWITRYHNPSQQGARATKILGKYTGNSIRCSEYGGWSTQGMERFNELCSLVEADRSSRNAREAEEQVMLSLRRTRFGEQPSQNGEANMNDQQTIMDLERTLERNVGIVNAFIEL